ncbi:MAG: hypothetical protein IJ806_06630 [Ruminococcus sp.]|nr:hypothetical protein [Ruminococcus sp.]
MDIINMDEKAVYAIETDVNESSYIKGLRLVTDRNWAIVSLAASAVMLYVAVRNFLKGYTSHGWVFVVLALALVYIALIKEPLNARRSVLRRQSETGYGGIRASIRFYESEMVFRNVGEENDLCFGYDTFDKIVIDSEMVIMSSHAYKALFIMRKDIPEGFDEWIIRKCNDARIIRNGSVKG